MAALPNNIYIGSVTQPMYNFDNSTIVLNSLTAAFAADVVSNELSVDTFSFTVRYNPDAPVVYAPVGKSGYLDTNNALYLLRAARTSAKDYLKDVPYGTPVLWYISGAYYCRGYVQSIVRVQKYGWKITCISGIGLLDERQHVGGMISGTLVTLLRSIIGNSFAFRFSDASVQNLSVFGHLPYATARQNLHAVLFAYGLVLRRWASAGYDYQVEFPNTATQQITDDKVALGGSVDLQVPATRAEVTEHSYVKLAGTAAEVLFDNTSETAVTRALVLFSDPVYDLTTTGTLVINASNCNYAIITGLGTLSGKKYLHGEKVISVDMGAEGEKERTVRVTDNHMINSLNSGNTALRLMDYYRSARRLKAKIQIGRAQKCGASFSMNDAFGDPTQAFLEKANVLVTSVLGASCELVEGYIPAHTGNQFSRAQIIHAPGGTFTVPDGVTAVRIVLIGAGSGGSGGYDGEEGCGGSGDPEFKTKKDALYYEIDPQFSDKNASALMYSQGQPVKFGGAAGQPGAAGKILIVDRAVSTGEVLTVAAANGGAGGARNGGAGTAGADTTLSSSASWSLTSADGAVSEAGYTDPLSSNVYALPGEAGHAGGDGGLTDSVSLLGCGLPQPRYPGVAPMAADGYAGSAVGDYQGGAGGAGLATRGNTGFASDPPSVASGGGGGGAAWGANGSAGEPGYCKPSEPTEGGRTRAVLRGGAGGAGANAVAPVRPNYGSGGGGGNGGGAGGSAGGCWAVWSIGDPQESPPDLRFWIMVADRGAAGLGSSGGQGGHGCAIIYY